MAITDWPAEQRPREKLLNQGPETLSDAELLAIFLRTGIAGTNAVELSRQLLAEHGGLRPLLALDQSQFCQARGLGTAKFVQLQAALEIGRRYLHARLRDRTALANPDDTRLYLKMQLRDRHKEVFSCLFLDNRHRVIAFEELFQGTIDGAAVHPREVVRVALRHNAAAVIAAHNHPSGVAEPSSSDIAITRRLKEALDTVDIRLLDHFIIGDGNPVSLAERGLM